MSRSDRSIPLVPFRRRFRSRLHCLCGDLHSALGSSLGDEIADISDPSSGPSVRQNTPFDRSFRQRAKNWGAQW
jgi:hypothetical protein